MTALRDVRESKGFSQLWFAARAGVSASHLAKIEDGVKAPNIKTAESFSRLLGVAPSDIDEFQEIFEYHTWKDVRLPSLKPSKTVGVVYFIQEGENGCIKIGWAASMENVSARLVNFQTGNPRPLRIVATMPGTMSVEKNLHGSFHEHRAPGGTEWFRPNTMILGYIKEHCYPYATS